MSVVSIDAAELAALRTLAKRAIELSESPSRPVRDRSGMDVSKLPWTWQEANAMEALAMARGAVVPKDRVIRHVQHNLKCSPDEWVREPMTVISRVRAKADARFGVPCVETVWNTRVNRKGQVVRDLRAGIEGYRWIGPDLAGQALAAIADLGVEVS